MLARPAWLLLLVLTAASAADELDPLFIRAGDDPAAVAPLIIAASKRIGELRGSEQTALADRLAPFCRAAFFGAKDHPGMDALGVVSHVIAKGEVPVVIAKRYRIAAGLLAVLNDGFAATGLQIGEALRVLDLRTPLRLVVFKDRYRLLAWRGDTLLGCFPVGLGAADKPTPEGESTIALRVRNPEWRDPDSGKVIPPKDPRNILGGYWLAFAPGADQRFKSIGMHGYTGGAAADWIEKPGSHGCVRMLQPDIALVFDIALPGTPVTVR